MATLNGFTDGRGDEERERGKEINKRVLEAFNVVHNKLMFHIDFPLNWKRKINWRKNRRNKTKYKEE